MPNGGPPDKWTKFQVDNPQLTSDEVLDKLNELAEQGFNSVATTVQCQDGLFVFVGGYAQYSKSKKSGSKSGT